MEKLTTKEKMERYVVKCNMLGIKNFEFEYNDTLDEVVITNIFVDKSNEVLIPKFVSRVEFSAWYENKSMKDCKIVIPKGCIIDFGMIDLDPQYDGLSNHVGEIEVEEGHEYYSSQDGVLFNKDKTILLAYPRYKQETVYSVPHSVVRIADNAFIYNGYLKRLNIKKNVIQIGRCDWQQDTEINISKQNSSYKSVKGSLYSKDGKILYSLFAPQGCKIKIEEGTILIENILIEGCFDELFLPNTIKFINGIPMILDEHITYYDLIRAPKRLRKYLKKQENYFEVIYY